MATENAKSAADHSCLLLTATEDAPAKARKYDVWAVLDGHAGDLQVAISYGIRCMISVELRQRIDSAKELAEEKRWAEKGHGTKAAHVHQAAEVSAGGHMGDTDRGATSGANSKATQADQAAKVSACCSPSAAELEAAESDESEGEYLKVANEFASKRKAAEKCAAAHVRRSFTANQARGSAASRAD